MRIKQWPVALWSVRKLLLLTWPNCGCRAGRRRSASPSAAASLPQLMISWCAINRRQHHAAAVQTGQPATTWTEGYSGAENGVPISGPPITVLHRSLRQPLTRGFPQCPILGAPWRRTFSPTLPRSHRQRWWAPEDNARPPPTPRENSTLCHVPGPHPGAQTAFSWVLCPLRVAAPLATRPASRPTGLLHEKHTQTLKRTYILWKGAQTSGAGRLEESKK